MPTWLLVEDEADIHDAILGLFEIWGVDGRPFSDSEDAIDWLNDLDTDPESVRPPQLALLDIRLPTLSGLEVARRIRQSPIIGNIPIVLMTAYQLSPDKELQTINYSQADMLVYKPLPSSQELRRILEELLIDKLD